MNVLVQYTMFSMIIPINVRLHNSTMKQMDDGDTLRMTLRRRHFNGEWVSLFLFGFLSFFVWVSTLQWFLGECFFFFWLSGWMYYAFCLGLYIVVFSDEMFSPLKTTSSEEFMFRHKRSRISYTFSDEFYFRH